MLKIMLKKVLITISRISYSRICSSSLEFFYVSYLSDLYRLDFYIPEFLNNFLNKSVNYFKVYQRRSLADSTLFIKKTTQCNFNNFPKKTTSLYLDSKILFAVRSVIIWNDNFMHHFLVDNSRLNSLAQNCGEAAKKFLESQCGNGD